MTDIKRKKIRKKTRLQYTLNPANVMDRRVIIFNRRMSRIEKHLVYVNAMNSYITHLGCLTDFDKFEADDGDGDGDVGSIMKPAPKGEMDPELSNPEIPDDAEFDFEEPEDEMDRNEKLETILEILGVDSEGNWGESLLDTVQDAENGDVKEQLVAMLKKLELGRGVKQADVMQNERRPG